MTVLPSVLAEMRRRWLAAGVPLRPGVSDAERRGFEQRYRVRLPASLAEYSRMFDGIDEGGWDEHLIRFWPLAQVRPASEALPSWDPELLEGYFVFADYSIWALLYAVQLGSEPGDVVQLGNGARRLAPSFEAFLALYLNEPLALF